MCMQRTITLHCNPLYTALICLTPPPCTLLYYIQLILISPNVWFVMCGFYTLVYDTAVQLVFNPFSHFVPQLELYSQLQLRLWSDPIGFSVPKST